VLNSLIAALDECELRAASARKPHEPQTNAAGKILRETLMLKQNSRRFVASGRAIRGGAADAHLALAGPKDILDHAVVDFFDPVNIALAFLGFMLSLFMLYLVASGRDLGASEASHDSVVRVVDASDREISQHAGSADVCAHACIAAAFNARERDAPKGQRR
jgi:hypothetical protein